MAGPHHLAIGGDDADLPIVEIGVALRQTGKGRDIPIILFDESYWRDVVNFDRLAKEGVIAPEDMNLFSFADTPRAAWEAIGAMKRS